MDLLHTLLTGGIIGAITGIVGLYIALQKLRPEKRILDATANKTDAEHHEILGKAWADLVFQLRDDLKLAREEIAQLRAELEITKAEAEKCALLRSADRQMIRILRQQVAALMAQIAETGLEPYEVVGIRDVLNEK